MIRERTVATDRGRPTGPPPLLQVRGVSKSYGAVHALTDATLDFHAGEVHAIVGENGAGKTTLERIIAGEVRHDAGEVLMEGTRVDFRSPAEGRAGGVAVVHQDFPLVPAMTVAENMFLGGPPLGLRVGRMGLLARGRMSRAAAEALAPFGLGGAADREIRSLGVAERQLVEIARATVAESKVIIFDEPTSALSPSEVQVFFEHVERIRAGGAAVLFISHRIDEVMRIAHRISALRDGRVVHTSRKDELDSARVVSLIAGRSMDSARRHRPAPSAEPLLSASIAGPAARCDLAVRRGEILGVAGLLGSGAQALIAALSGQVIARGDEITLGEASLSRASLRRRVAAGLCLLPGDQERALALHMSIEDNVLLPSLGRFRRGPMIDRVRLRDRVEQLIGDLGIRPASAGTRVSALSGGNKQKVAIAKWLASHARVILMDDPFRGVDVGAKAEISGVIERFVDDGGGVILYSSDTRELTAVADRILVMRGGAIVEELASAPFDEDAIMAAAVGATGGSR